MLRLLLPPWPVDRWPVARVLLCFFLRGLQHLVRIRPRFVGLRQHLLDREQDARELAARRDLVQRSRLLALVRREQELEAIPSRRADALVAYDMRLCVAVLLCNEREVRLEARAGHAELRE